MSSVQSYLAHVPRLQVVRVTWLYFDWNSKWTEIGATPLPLFQSFLSFLFLFFFNCYWGELTTFLLSPRCFSFCFLSIVGCSCCSAMFSFSMLPLVSYWFSFTFFLLNFFLGVFVFFVVMLHKVKCFNVGAGQPSGTNAKWQQTIWSNKIKRAYEVGGLTDPPTHRPTSIISAQKKQRRNKSEIEL